MGKSCSETRGQGDKGTRGRKPCAHVILNEVKDLVWDARSFTSFRMTRTPCLSSPCPLVTLSPCQVSRPDLHFALQVYAFLLHDPLADGRDEPQDVIGRRAGVGDDEVGVLGADLGAADAEAFQAGLV